MTETTPTEAAGEPVVADLSYAPLPTDSMLRRRSNPLLQATRFVSFSARIMRMVMRGHDS